MERFTMADYTGADFIEKEYEKIVKEFQKDYKALDNLFVVLVDKAELWRSDKDKYAFRYYFDNNGLLHHPTNDNIAKIYENLAVKCRNLFFDLYADNREKVNYFDYFYCGGFTMKIS